MIGTPLRRLPPRAPAAALALAGLLAACDGGTPSREAAPPEGVRPLGFGIQVIDTAGVGCAPAGPGCARVLLSFPEIEDGDEAAAVPVRRWVQERLLDFPLEEPGDVPATPRDWIVTFLEAHERFQADFPGGWGGWFIARDIRVVRNDAQVVTLALEESSYLGGAHPNHVVVFHNVDAVTGAVLRLEDLILPEALPEVRVLASEAVRRALGVDSGGSLVDAGLMDEILPLPASALLTREAVLLEYNPYEVAPYAMGAIRARIPWSRLEPFLSEPSRWLP